MIIVLDLCHLMSITKSTHNRCIPSCDNQNTFYNPRVGCLPRWWQCFFQANFVLSANMLMIKLTDCYVSRWFRAPTTRTDRFGAWQTICETTCIIYTMGLHVEYLGVECGTATFEYTLDMYWDIINIRNCLHPRLRCHIKMRTCMTLGITWYTHYLSLLLLVHSRWWQYFFKASFVIMTESFS